MGEGSFSVSDKLADAILNLVAQVPPPGRRPAMRRARPRVASCGWPRPRRHWPRGLALPTGPAGWLTILPELLAVWRIQAQMVSDIAALYGARHAPTREQMLYCLFRHAAAQAVRDVLARATDRWLVQEASGAVLRRAAQAIGLKLTQKVARRGASRWMPLVGAAGVGVYAWLDTRQVARTAISLFQGPAGRPPPLASRARCSPPGVAAPAAGCDAVRPVWRRCRPADAPDP